MSMFVIVNNSYFYDEFSYFYIESLDLGQGQNNNKFQCDNKKVFNFFCFNIYQPLGHKSIQY